MTAPLVARMVIDAQSEFARAIAHVPPAGRGPRLGRLNTAAWAIAHTASIHDLWLNAFCRGRDRDPWLQAWGKAQQALPEGDALDTSFSEALAAYERIAPELAAYLDALSDADLAPVIELFAGSEWEGRTVGYLVARASAHLFAHAGEMSVIASLVLTEDRDLGLPGRMKHSLGEGGEARDLADGPPIIVPLLFDARGEFRRVAAATPVPSQVGAFRRLSAGSWIVAHIAAQDDQLWNVGALEGDADPWLAALDVGYGSPPSEPDYAQALAALDRSFERSLAFLEGLDETQFERVFRKSSTAARANQTVGDMVVRQTAHLVALTGELAAISSLAGAHDPGLPGALDHVAALWQVSSD
ncbi:MAG TPA: DinB family protein [Dehalococcoidia bacterium]|nr:DinB family protein [Dehalococcoidia bacterium]